jgi:phosphoglycerate dehydrogenase-like enzyme
MDKVIDKSDIIYVCLPLTQETVGIIDEKKLSRMKDKYLINVGRGVIIDEKALFDALSKKILRGAGIDVWYNYPKSKEINQPSRYPFHTLPNVVLSPHVAGFTSYAVAENVIETIANIKNFLRKGNPKTTISIDDRY